MSPERHFRKFFYFRCHSPPKSEIASRSNRHLSQSRLQVTGYTAERYCLLHVVVQRPGSFRGRCMTYDCGATGRQSCPIFGFLPISPYKTPKKYLQVTSLEPTLHRRMITIFPCGSRRPKGCLPAAKFSYDLWELGNPKLAQIFAYGKWLYPYKMLLHGASDLDQRCLKTHNSKYGCISSLDSLLLSLQLFAVAANLKSIDYNVAMTNNSKIVQDRAIITMADI